MKEDTRPLMVTIQCFTYNQEAYIRECLEGFVMQKTNFRFEAIVHDDASTDNTANIIREYEEKYPDIIKPIYETENQYSKHDGSLDRIMNEHTHGKYIAICEGDDYWIDPAKLQKQVDFLESHPDYGLVYTNRYNLHGKKMEKVVASGKCDAISILIRTGIATLTTCFRSDLYFRYLEEINPQNKGWLLGDSPIWKFIAFNSKVCFLPDYTGVYRILPESASHSQDISKRLRFSKGMNDVQIYMLEKYVPKDKQNVVRKEINSGYYIQVFRIYMSMSHYKEGIMFMVKHFKGMKLRDLLNL